MCKQRNTQCKTKQKKRAHRFGGCSSHRQGSVVCSVQKTRCLRCLLAPSLQSFPSRRAQSQQPPATEGLHAESKSHRVRDSKKLETRLSASGHHARSAAGRQESVARGPGTAWRPPLQVTKRA